MFMQTPPRWWARLSAAASRILPHTFCLAVMTLTMASARAAPDMGVLQALAGVYSNAAVSSKVVAYCRSESASNAAQADKAQQAWRKRHLVDEVARQFEASLPSSQLSALNDKVQTLDAKLRDMGPPEKACAHFIQAWEGSEMDMRKQFPLAYRPDGSVASLKAATAAAQAVSSMRADDHATSSRDATQGATAQPARPAGTVYDVAQLPALVDQWRAGASYDDKLRRMSAAGRIYIKGKVEKRKDSYFVTHNDGTFTASLPVAPGISLAAYEGQDIVIGGTFDELPSSVAFLRDAAIVQDASALRPANLPTERGLTRMTVDESRIRTAPGKGVPHSDIVAVVHEAHNEMNFGGGLDFVETVYLLLRDGSTYTRTDVPPEDLDVKASRKLEPQYWGRWEAAGKGKYKVRLQDQWGHLPGEWQTVNGFATRPWETDRRLDATYETQHFHGSLMTGGLATKDHVTFRPDGRFEAVGSAVFGTGSMQAINGYTGSAGSFNDGKGTTSHAGGNANGVGAYTFGKRRNDGDEHRGTYRFDGYSLELRYDSGRVARMPSFAWNDSLDHIYLRGESYSAARRK